MKSYLASPLIFTLALLLLGASKLATSCPIDPAVREYTQLDGKTHFFAHAWGDEFLYNFETEDGYEIVKATDGWYYYATLDSTGDYTSSHYKVGLDDPSHQFRIFRIQFVEAKVIVLRWCNQMKERLSPFKPRFGGTRCSGNLKHPAVTPSPRIVPPDIGAMLC